MKKIFNIFSLIAVSASLLCGCKGELVDTNQYAEAGVAGRDTTRGIACRAW